jgi:hypothetical protein
MRYSCYREAQKMRKACMKVVVVEIKVATGRMMIMRDNVKKVWW